MAEQIVGIMQLPLPLAGGQEVAPAVIRDLVDDFGAFDVVADVKARIDQGIRTYGQPLRTDNGRAFAVDAYQEALDLALYLKQMHMQVSVLDYARAVTILDLYKQSLSTAVALRGLIES